MAKENAGAAQNSSAAQTTQVHAKQAPGNAKQKKVKVQSIYNLFYQDELWAHGDTREVSLDNDIHRFIQEGGARIVEG